MADLNIFDVKPHQVSRDMRGYSVFIYGDAKTGKTTCATKFPRHLLLAFEKGYSAIPGAMALPINSWSEFRKALKQLKTPEAHQAYETIILDTSDIAYDYVEKYICSNYVTPEGIVGVDSIGKIPYGQGYKLAEKEFDECLRSIVQMDYGLVLISHATDKTFKNEQGEEYNQIVPTLAAKPRNIVSRLCDIIGYSRTVQDKEGNTSTKLFMRGTPRYMAGSRFKYSPEYINFDYDSLVEAINDAIDKQMAESGKDLFKEERNNLYIDTSKDLDYDELMNEFNTLITDLTNSVPQEDFIKNYQPQIIAITDKYLGKGRKASQCTREQVEALSLIVDDIKDLAEKAKS